MLKNKPNTRRQLGGARSVETVCQPPYNNMGAEITAPSENRVLIDWLSWTLKTTCPHEAIAASGLSCLEFSASSGGGMGYKSSLRSGNIVVFFDGQDGMGVHISMSGQGCRQYEAYKATPHCWFQLLHKLASVDAVVTRLDIAIDNVDGVLSLDKLETAIRNKEIRSRFRSGQLIEGLNLTESVDLLGKTIYLGSRQSRLKCRFYDKAAQVGLPCHWVRAEIQMMAERAQVFIAHMLKGRDEVGHLAVSALNQYFAVVILNDTNKSRCDLADWWAAWITTTDKIRLTTCKAIKLVHETMEHISRQYSASFVMIKRFLGTVNFHDFLHEMLDKGKEKQTKKHDMIIACSRLDLESVYPF